MESHAAGIARCFNAHASLFSWRSRRPEITDTPKLKYHVVGWNASFGSERLICLSKASTLRYPSCHPSWRTFGMPINLKDEPSLSSMGDYSTDNDEIPPDDPLKMVLPQKLEADELKSLLADIERSKLIKKLSEANQHNRFLKRQLQIREDEFANVKSELAVLDFEIQALVTLAKEVAKSGIQPDSRKINGKYIQSHLLSRLKGVQKILKKQMMGVDALQLKEVPLFWYGMAESVQVMGSFDGWSHGEHMSPEHTGSFNQFTTTLTLRPGRYEIKFLVDGEWHLSPEFPTIGEGTMQNNLLLVE